MSASVAVVALCAAVVALLLSGLLGGFWFGVEFRVWWEQWRRRHPVTAEDSNGRRLLAIAHELRQGAYLPDSPWPRAQLLDMATDLRAIAEEHERIVETLTLDQRERADVDGATHLGEWQPGKGVRVQLRIIGDDIAAMRVERDGLVVAKHG